MRRDRVNATDDCRLADFPVSELLRELQNLARRTACFPFPPGTVVRSLRFASS